MLTDTQLAEWEALAKGVVIDRLPDGAFIADADLLHARASAAMVAVPDLVAEVRRLRAELEKSTR